MSAAFRHGPRLTRSSELRRRDYLERIARGGYPEAVRRTQRRRSAFFESYLTTLIERDVSELAVIERRGELRALLALLAGRSGGLLVPTSLTNQSGLPRTTLTRYLALLEAVFLIKEVPGLGGRFHTTRNRDPQTGVRRQRRGLPPARPGRRAPGRTGGAAGSMVENFVLMELARQLTWSDERATLHHYRTEDKVEVDAVIEAADGRVIGIEVKAGATVRSEDLAGLRHLQRHLGSNFVAGYVLYTGQQTLPFGDGLRALPLSALWQTAP